MSSTPLNTKQICRLWGVRKSYIDEKIQEILTIIETDINESYLLQKLNEHGMDVQNVIVDITDPNSSFNNNTNHNHNISISDDEEINNNNENEYFTTLHKYPMIGPFARSPVTKNTKFVFKWNCDNKKCTKNRAQRAYNMPYYKSKQLDDQFTLCQKCVISNKKDSNPLKTNQTIGNINTNSNTNSNYNMKRTRNRKRKRGEFIETRIETVCIEPKTKKRRVSNMMNTLSLNNNNSNKENENINNKKQEATEIIIKILNENNNELNRDKLVSKLNKEISNNNKGMSWRRLYRLTLGNVDEFIKNNNKFDIEDSYKRNYLITLNDNISDIGIQENDPNDEENKNQTENENDDKKSEEQSTIVSDVDSELPMFPKQNRNGRRRRRPRRKKRATKVTKRIVDLEFSLSESEDIEIDDKNDSDYQMSDYEQMPSNNNINRPRRQRKRKLNLKAEMDDSGNENSNNASGPTTNTNTKSSMKEEADSDDDYEENRNKNVEKKKEIKRLPLIPPLPKPKPKINNKWKYKLFNPLKIKYNIKPKPVKKDPEQEERIRHYESMGLTWHHFHRKEKPFEDIKPIERIGSLYELKSSQHSYDEIVKVEYNKNHIVSKDNNILKSLYDESFRELFTKPKKPKKKKGDKPIKKSSNRKDYTVQCEITKTKELHSRSEKVTKKYSQQLEITLNRLQKTGNCFIVDIPATIALISKSKELTQDIVESINMLREYTRKGHTETSISLLDFACRYNDNDIKVIDHATQCKICYKSPMVNPKEIPCGCKFCNQCIWNYFVINDGEECPICEREWDDGEWEQFVFDDDYENEGEGGSNDIDNKENDGDMEVETIRQKAYGLTVVTFPYQVQSIEWMIDKENDDEGLYKYLFKKGQFKNGEIFYYSAVLHRLVLTDTLPIIRGGWLCEEMGLGKTVECIAIININKRNDEYSTGKKNVVALKETAVRKRRVEVKQPNTNNPWTRINNDNDGNEHGLFRVQPKKKKKKYIFVEEEREYTYYKGKGTLIIGPVSLIGQWELEIDTKSKKKLTYKRYYGSRSRNIKSYLDFDIIFTTYGVLAKEDGNDRKNHVLHKIQWHRIILDESHYIKNGTCRTAININELKGINKWLLSGTPFNRQIDLENQLRFLGVANEYLNAMKLKTGNFYSNAVVKIVKYMMMRHKKAQKFNNKQIVNMPEKKEDVIYVNFDEKQKEYYDKLYKTAQETFDSYKATGNISRGFIPILSSLHPARQACSGYIANMNEIEKQLAEASSHTEAVRSMVSRNRGKTAQQLYQLARNEAYNKDGHCVICLEVPPDQPLQTQCNHIFCGECIRQQLEANGNCPICRRKCDINKLKRPLSEKKEEELDENENKNNNHNQNEETINENGNENGLNNENVIIKFDAKLKVLVEELNKLQINKPNDKSLIFTSFSKSLDWICSELDKNGIKYCTLTGAMPMQKRANNLKAFSSDPSIKVFVLTVRTGAVGLTLTAANHVFMMEPTFNPSLHRQAINRVYRLGQKKKVFIHTLIMKHSIEQRIWDINKEKQMGDIDNKKNKNMYGNIKEDKVGGLETSEIEKLFQQGFEDEINEQGEGENEINENENGINQNENENAINENENEGDDGSELEFFMGEFDFPY